MTAGVHGLQKETAIGFAGNKNVPFMLVSFVSFSKEADESWPTLLIGDVYSS
jgi:hypothetical protein